MTLQHVIGHLVDAVVAKEHRRCGIGNRTWKRVQFSDVFTECLFLGAQLTSRGAGSHRWEQQR